MTSSSRKNQSRTLVFDRLGSPTATTAQRTGTQDPPFRAGAGRGARHRPYPEQRKKTNNISSASSARQRWRGPGGLCPTVEESAGHRHCWGRGGHYFPSETWAHPLMHQLPDQKQPARAPVGHGRLAVEGGHRAGHQRDIPRVLQPTVSGVEEDRRSSSGDRPFHSQSPHGTVETLYSTIPYTTIFYITRWTHGPQNLQWPIRTPIVLLGFGIKQIFV